MESPNQDAMLNEQSKTFSPDTGGVIQAPDQNTMLNEEYNPTDLSGNANTLPTTLTDEEEAAMGSDGSGMASGSPNMEPDTLNYGNGDTLGNNDGTESDPEQVDPAFDSGSN
ncbi:hypothetical protein [Spirosoma utsteinense]|uniref:Adhesin n=1 Tax=Spirosoma utsteinense TaxID=2585773 RepID=A0ABR6W9H1_9BACT|nr:hypothetical protein [Spirosoma utsteinense]MBC3783976.1 hypothetical protein [Spirosoma utsteinense]MBC3792611.1 hypothetical protein [Spirosoma utsteinense]